MQTYITKFGKSQFEGWEWDGKVLKPFGESQFKGWEWDGKILKPFGESQFKGWEWDGKILKPFGESQFKGWEWDGKILKPFGKSQFEGWQVDGDAPIFVVALASNLIGEAITNENFIKSSSRSIPKKSKSKSKKNGPSNAEEVGEIAMEHLIQIVKKVINLIRARIR
jgi:hypothetical protein